MTYSHVLYDSIEGVPWEDWNLLRSGEDDPFMDRRFIDTVARSMADEGEYWMLIVYDAEKRPVATACLTLMQIDGAILTDGLIRRMVCGIRRLWRRYLYFKVLVLGLPVSAGQSHLRIRPDADTADVLRVLDQILADLAARHRARLILLKEFDTEAAERLAGLEKVGYLRGDSLAMNRLDPQFRSFDEFCAALRSHYRYKIRRSQRKFEKAGLRVEHLRGEAILPHYSEQTHRLYGQVVERAEVRFESLPVEFFHELVRHFPEEVHFTAVFKEDRIVAFGWGLFTGGVYRDLFVGVDYEFNAEADLYFNLMIHDLDHAMRLGAKDIHLGQTAEVFKSRLGCCGSPRYVYLKATPSILSWVMRATSGWIFPPQTPAPSRDLFRDPTH